MEAKTTLITTLGKYGISIQADDIKEILTLGLDTFLLRKGMSMPDKYLSELHIIIFEMREQL